MNSRITVCALTTIITLLFIALLLPRTVSGSERVQTDPTAQQQTIDAVVISYFTQTAQAQQQMGLIPV